MVVYIVTEQQNSLTPLSLREGVYNYIIYYTLLG